MQETKNDQYKKYAPKIRKHLNDTYYKKGCIDFYFKSRHIKKDVGLSSLVVGRAMKHLSDIVVIWNDSNTNAHVYKTTFKKT